MPPKQSPPHFGVFLLFSPSPSLTPVTSCCLQHLGKVGANGCPCSGIPSTLHPVRRGGNLGTGSGQLCSPAAPAWLPVPCQSPACLAGDPVFPWGPCAPLTPLHSFPLQHESSVGSGWGQKKGPSRTSSAPLARAANAGIALSSRGIPGCPRAQAHAAWQLLALLKGIFWSKGTIVGTLGCPWGVH